MKILKHLTLIALVCYGSSVLAMTRFEQGQAESAALDFGASLEWQADEMEKVVAEMKQKTWKENALQIQQELKALRIIQNQYTSESQRQVLQDASPYGVEGLRRRWIYLNKISNVTGAASLKTSPERVLFNEISGTLLFWNQI